MISIHQALEHLLPAFEPTGSVRMPLERALGRVLAEQLLAREPSPAFDNSAMDGYAVRAADCAGASEHTPVRLPVTGESRAGGLAPSPLAARTAIRIFTGAPVPAGADAIVIQENTSRDGDIVVVRSEPRPGAHVRGAGEDLSAGSVMLAPGAVLGPGEIGLLASQRYAYVAVHRPPRVAVLCTGDELREVSDPPEPGTIVDSNAYAIAAQVRRAGGEPVLLPRAPDDPTVIAERIRDGLDADVLVSCGGVSVGAHDHVHEALQRAGVELGFWKVAIKPGKPLTFGTAGNVPVVGLPGNPVSAMVTFEVLVRPGLRRMAGDPRPHPEPEPVFLETAVEHKTGRTEMLRAALRRDGDRLVARPVARQGSGALPSMAGADALVVLPAQSASFGTDERLWALPLAGRRARATSPFAPGGPLDEGEPGR